MKENFTILIQGPLNEISLQNISNYLKYGKEVIISHWNSDNLELIKKYQQENVKFISQDFPGKNIPKGCDPNSTFYWAVCSTSLGIFESKTLYTIKTRSDEFFSDLNPLINKVLANENKLICANILFRKWASRPYHIGDHLFASRTEYLVKAYQNLLDNYHQQKGNISFCQHFLWCAEQILAAAFLSSFNILLTPKIPSNFNRKNYNFNQVIDHSSDLMQKYFDVIDVNLLGPFQGSWKRANITWNDRYINDDNIYNDIEDCFK